MQRCLRFIFISLLSIILVSKGFAQYTAKNNDQIVLAWTWDSAIDGIASQFVVQESTTIDGPFTPFAAASGSTTETDSKVIQFPESVTRLYYRVYAVDSDGIDGEASAPIYVDQTSPTINGPLRIHPGNPRYFTDDLGKPILLTGAHTWENFQDGGTSDPPPVFDYTAYLDFLQAHNHNFFRFWRMEHGKGGYGVNVNNYWFSPQPWARPGPGTALDGKPEYDLNQFNQAYFDRMRSRIIAAGQRGIYASIMLFDGWSIVSKGGDHNPWPGHPFHASNNINGVNGDPNGNGQGEETHSLMSPPLLALQEGYIRKVVDTVNDLDNVLYEISNETDGVANSWQYAMISYLRNYQANKPKQHPIGMTVPYPNGNNADLFASAADWISLNGDVNNPPVASGSKVIIADTDHLCGICGDRNWVWKSFTRGENPIFMDPYEAGVTTWGSMTNYDPNNSNDVSLRRNMGYLADYARRIDLASMLPKTNLASTGYCLASNTELLSYAPSGGSFTVNLSGNTSSFAVEWMNPSNGAITTGGQVAGGVTRTFTPPFTGDAVLYLKADQTPPPEPQPIVTFSVNPTSIVAGNSATLQWTSSDATAVSISGIGDVTLSGSLTVNPTATTTYTLTATGNGGTTTASATLTVTEPPPPPQPVQISGLTLNKTSIKYGQSARATITLNAVAPADGQIVAITVSDPTIAFVPSTVTVPAGTTTQNFLITTERSPAGGKITKQVMITASANSTDRSVILTIKP